MDIDHAKPVEASLLPQSVAEVGRRDPEIPTILLTHTDLFLEVRPGWNIADVGDGRSFRYVDPAARTDQRRAVRE